MEERGEKPAIWLIDNTLPGGRSLNLQLVKEGAAKWNLPDLEKMGTNGKKGGFGSEDEPESSLTDLEGAIEVQMALVNLMLESSLKNELMAKLVEAKMNLVESNLASICLGKGEDVPRRKNDGEERLNIDADIGVEEPELERY